MDPLPGTQYTNAWMADPWMTDPTQKSNQFSLFNNQALPWPSSYNGVPVNAATGQPIQSYLNWQAQQPQQGQQPGVTLNQTQQQPQFTRDQILAMIGRDPGLSSPQGWGSQPAASQAQSDWYNRYTTLALGQPMSSDPTVRQQQMDQLNALARHPPGGSPRAAQAAMGPNPQQQAGMAGAQGGTNNWYAAINALANPGTPQIQGATVPTQAGYQPAGGVNQAFLNNAASSGGNINQNFVAALNALQNRRS